MPVPIEIVQEPSGFLSVAWDDGHRSRHGYRALRILCPCALCLDEWTGERRLDAAKIPLDIYPKEIGRVGAYALRFTWSDGHLTGIYTFKFLRQICECADCAHARAGQASAHPPPT